MRRANVLVGTLFILAVVFVVGSHAPTITATTTPTQTTLTANEAPDLQTTSAWATRVMQAFHGVASDGMTQAADNSTAKQTDTELTTKTATTADPAKGNEATATNVQNAASSDAKAEATMVRGLSTTFERTHPAEENLGPAYHRRL